MTILEQLGLSRKTVLRLTNSWERIPSGSAPPRTDNPPRYPEGDEQKALIARIRQDTPVILALACAGMTAADIARNEGVSAECVLRKIRPYGLAGKRGRPRSSSRNPRQKADGYIRQHGPLPGENGNDSDPQARPSDVDE